MLVEDKRGPWRTISRLTSPEDALAFGVKEALTDEGWDVPPGTKAGFN